MVNWDFNAIIHCFICEGESVNSKDLSVLKTEIDEASIRVNDHWEEIGFLVERERVKVSESVTREESGALIFQVSNYHVVWDPLHHHPLVTHAQNPIYLHFRDHIHDGSCRLCFDLFCMKLSPCFCERTLFLLLQLWDLRPWISCSYLLLPQLHKHYILSNFRFLFQYRSQSHCLLLFCSQKIYSLFLALSQTIEIALYLSDCSLNVTLMSNDILLHLQIPCNHGLLVPTMTLKL